MLVNRLTRVFCLSCSRIPATAKQMLIHTAMLMRQYLQRTPKKRRCFRCVTVRSSSLFSSASVSYTCCMVAESCRQHSGSAANMISVLCTGISQQPECRCEILQQDGLHEGHGSVVNTPMQIGTVLRMHSSLLHSMTKCRWLRWRHT